MASGNRGVFALERDTFKRSLFKREPLCEIAAWAWLNSEAQWAERSVRRGRAEIPLVRGQLAASRADLAEAWMWTDARVRGFLDRLEKAGEIHRLATSETTILTICFYDEIQFGPPADESKNNQPVASPSPAPNQHTKKGIIESVNNQSSFIGGQDESDDPASNLPSTTAVSPSLPTKRKRPAKELTPLPEGFGLDTQLRQDAVARGVPIDEVDRVFRSFCDWSLSKGTLNKDWRAAFRTWAGNYKAFDRGRTGQPAKGPHGYSNIVEIALQAAQRTRET